MKNCIFKKNTKQIGCVHIKYINNWILKNNEEHLFLQRAHTHRHTHFKH